MLSRRFQHAKGWETCSRARLLSGITAHTDWAVQTVRLSHTHTHLEMHGNKETWGITVCINTDTGCIKKRLRNSNTFSNTCLLLHTVTCQQTWTHAETVKTKPDYHFYTEFGTYMQILLTIWLLFIGSRWVCLSVFLVCHIGCQEQAEKRGTVESSM